MPKRQKNKLLLLSLLLWAQMVFTVGLMAWRYRLVLFANGEVYVSYNSPGTEQFVEFADQNCPQGQPFAYLSSHYRGHARFRYGLYPRRSFNLSTAVTQDPTFATANRLIEAEQIACLVVDYLALNLPSIGEKRALNADQYLIVLSDFSP